MSFWSDPIGSTEQAIKGLGNDITNLPKDVSSFISNPKQATANLLANPFMPALIGGTASALSGGALTPLMAGLAVGGTEAAASGSIKKGLMAGVGAYGGSTGVGDVATAGGNTVANNFMTGNLTPDQIATLANGDTATVANSTYLAGLSNPSAILAAASPGGTASDALHLSGTALQAANGPNGNAILGGANVAQNAQTPTDNGSVTNSIYARNPYAAKDLNLIGAQYTPGENPDTSERRYFDPVYITPTTGLPAANANTMTGTTTPTVNANTMTGTTTPTATAGAGSENQAISRAAMGGLQATPQSQMVNMPNPNAPMSHDLVDAYHRPQAQMPVPQPVMMAEGGSDHHAHMAARKSIAEDESYNLGGYSDGGRLLRGPGDGVSDSIPATIGHKQPARLADGEFVVPARIVSELGNGSTEAGARKLYAMLDRIQAARSKTVGKGNVAKNSRADKHLPA